MAGWIEILDGRRASAAVVVSVLVEADVGWCEFIDRYGV